MRTAYVIHDAADRAFVEHGLLKPLPCLGIDRWLSFRHVAAQTDGTLASLAQAIAVSDVVLAVVSSAAIDSTQVKDELELALKPPVPVQRGQRRWQAIDEEEACWLAHGSARVARCADSRRMLWRLPTLRARTHDAPRGPGVGR